MMILQGEWRVMKGGDSENVTSLIVDAIGYRIARAYPSRNGKESALDRARLMAVAPEMAALLNRYYSDHEMRDENGPCQCALCKEWRALLARIRGEG